MKTYVVMDLEFMILDTLDYVRPSAEYKKYENLSELKQACQTIEAFENLNFQPGKLILNNECSKQKGTINQMNEYVME